MDSSVGPPYAPTLYTVLPGAPEDDIVTREPQGSEVSRASPSAIGEVAATEVDSESLVVAIEVDSRIEASSAQCGPIRNPRFLMAAAAALAADLPMRCAADQPPCPWPAAGTASSYIHPSDPVSTAATHRRMSSHLAGIIGSNHEDSSSDGSAVVDDRALREGREQELAQFAFLDVVGRDGWMNR